MVVSAGGGSMKELFPRNQNLETTAKLSCSYSGFSSPRVEWKFTHGDIRGLVCYNNKITASYENRVSFLNGGITFQSVTRKDTGMYTCMVSDEGGNTYGEVTVQLIVLVPPSKPTINVPSSVTIGTRAVLTCSEKDGSPPSEYKWFKDGTFDPVSASDTGDFTCEAQNGYESPMRSDTVHMDAVELNVGGIVAAVLVTLILLGALIFGIWFSYSRGYFDRAKKGYVSCCPGAL
ncbi:F11R [Cervus elaphus hippelaphus]|uniref:Junctional adhesion molecule A n=1 Tax=Cervus elaphus hippelaphus TaxID=46360 RepID=A0A212CET4_CEREH|nr:F11R [Cervus elaphus hippelaphus]